MRNLRVFGADVFVHIPKQFRGKFEAKSWKGVFVGYSTNGYRIWNPRKNCIRSSRDVICVEETSVIHPENDVVILPSEIEDDNVVMQEIESEEDSANDTTENNSKESLVEEVVIGRATKTPRWHEDYDMSYAGYAFNALDFISDIPSSINELQKRNDWKQWQSAMDTEMLSMQKNNSWTLVKSPENRQIISCKWVFKIKRANNKDIYKARLVARGFSQKPGIDYTCSLC